MFLSPSAVGQVNVPWLTTVLAGTVVMVRTWQTAQPIWVNVVEPRCAEAVAATAASTGGALVERMNSVNAAMSTPNGWADSVASAGSGAPADAAPDTTLDG